ncbi:MAG TPA: hypothetical protein VLZ05_04015, partial [Mycobacterium sp.]
YNTSACVGFSLAYKGIESWCRTTPLNVLDSVAAQVNPQQFGVITPEAGVRGSTAATAQPAHDVAVETVVAATPNGMI